MDNKTEQPSDDVILRELRKMTPEQIRSLDEDAIHRFANYARGSQYASIDAGEFHFTAHYRNILISGLCSMRLLVTIDS